MDPFSQMMYQYYAYSSMRGLIPIPMMNNNNYIYQMNVGQNDITLANEANFRKNDQKKIGTLASRSMLPISANRNGNFFEYRPENYINQKREREKEQIIIIDHETPSSPQKKLKVVNENPSYSNNEEKGIELNQYEDYLLKKICEACRVDKTDDLLLLCDYCDDAYHSFCLTPILAEIPEKDEIWVCPECVNVLEKEQESEKNNVHEIKQTNCPECKLPLGKEEKECLECKVYFHVECFHKKVKNIICTKCEIKIKKRVSKKTNSLLYSQNESIDSSNKKKRKNHKKVNFSVKKSTFKLPKKLSEAEIINQKKSLFFAFESKHIEFNDDLVYVNKNCTKEHNNCILEPNLHILDKQNLEIFKKFKERTRRCEYPPVLIEQDGKVGFIVKAFEDIPEKTLICEYVGEVDFLRNKVTDKNDSIMVLLRTTRSKSTLVICPEKYGNLARFISGINNHCSKSKLKQNLNSVRYSIDGEARVILYAKRKISAGETLYYNYNAGGFYEYPTKDFV